MLSYLKSFLWSEPEIDSFGTPIDEPEPQIDMVGFQVMYIRPDSPSHLAGLIPVFDYIVAANDTQFFNKDDNSFVELVKSSAGKPITLQLYNSINDSFRVTTLVPAPVPDGSGAGYAGVVVRYSRFDDAHSLVWHIGVVHPGSPAQKAGLVEGSDYVVGSPNVVFSNQDDFSTYVAENIDVPLSFFVWNTVASCVRIVNVTPSLWGGVGLLGCEFLFGVLHRIPKTGVLPSFTLPPPDPQAQQQQQQPLQLQLQQQQQILDQQPLPIIPEPGVVPDVLAPLPAVPIPSKLYDSQLPIPVPIPVPIPTSPLKLPSVEPKSTITSTFVADSISTVSDELSSTSAVLEPSD